MNTKLFVGGIAWATTEETLEDTFAQHGEVTSAKIIKDRETGRSRGFGFVEFADRESAEKALEELNQTELDGRTIRVDWAKERR